MSKPSRRPSRRDRHDRQPTLTAQPATSEHGLLNREERRFAAAVGMTGEAEGPIPCMCANGHRWYAPGTFQAGVGTFFDDGADRWCSQCGLPEEFSSHLEPKGPSA